MKAHMWVELQQIRVEPQKDPEGNISVYATQEALEVGKENKVYGCVYCNEVLSADTIDEQCKG